MLLELLKQRFKSSYICTFNPIQSLFSLKLAENVPLIMGGLFGSGPAWMERIRQKKHKKTTRKNIPVPDLGNLNIFCLVNLGFLHL